VGSVIELTGVSPNVIEVGTEKVPFVERLLVARLTVIVHTEVLELKLPDASSEIVAVIVAVPTPATLNVFPLFVIKTMAELSLTYENVPVLLEVGDIV
jgi:hypothetical protein